jgi:hypothetical protein
MTVRPALLALALLPLPCTAGELYGRVDAAGHVFLSDVRQAGYSLVLRDPARPPATRPTLGGAAGVRCMPTTLDRIATEESVPQALLHAVATVESACNPAAVSAKGAQGLMQLMPGTAARYGVQRILDPADNVRGGARYLRDLLLRYEGRLELALAAYNAGEEAVARHANQIPPFAETRDYVRKVLDHYERLSLQNARERRR